MLYYYSGINSNYNNRFKKYADSTLNVSLSLSDYKLYSSVSYVNQLNTPIVIGNNTESVRVSVNVQTFDNLNVVFSPSTSLIDMDYASINLPLTYTNIEVTVQSLPITVTFTS